MLLDGACLRLHVRLNEDLTGEHLLTPSEGLRLLAGIDANEVLDAVVLSEDPFNVSRKVINLG